MYSFENIYLISIEKKKNIDSVEPNVKMQSLKKSSIQGNSDFNKVLQNLTKIVSKPLGFNKIYDQERYKKRGFTLKFH
jgi:hypothetical protein